MMFKKVLIVVFLFCLILPFVFKKEDKNTFSFWTVQLKAPAGDLIQKNIDLFQKKHPEINVVWVDIPIQEAKKRAIASILGGNPPDLINLNPEFSSSLAQKNSLEYFTEDDVKEYNDGLIEKLKYEGKIYALPFYATSAVTILNKDSFKNCNIKLETYDDILKLSNCKPRPVYGIALNEGDSFSKIINKYDNDFEKSYSLFKELNDNKFLLKDTLTVNHREVIEKYMANSASFITAGSNFINIIRQNAPDIYKNSVVLPQLKGKTGEYDISLMNFVIPKKAKNKELAKEFAVLLLNKENQMELAKKTNVLPVNKEALQDDYFKNCSFDIAEKSRCIAASQLDFPLKKDFGYKNKNEINETVNEYLELLFLKDEKIDYRVLENKIKTLQTN